MLPSDPRAGRSRSVARQPTTATTAARSRSASRPRERERERYSEYDDRSGRGRTAQDGGYARSVRPQRSTGNIRPSRTTEAPLPPPPLPSSSRSDYGSRSARTVLSSYSKPPASRDSDSSSVSMSSSGSSFLDRMRHRPAASMSSRSSFEADSDASKETGGADDARKPYLIRDEQTSHATNDLVSYGYSIWNRVASAASAWAWNGSSNAQISGVAPSSGDSEVTRALKAYHISKARDRSDLPDWLFSERERGLDSEKPTRQSGRSYERNFDGDDAEPVSRARGRGFRDIYDSVAASTPELRSRERDGRYAHSVLGSDTAPIRPASRATDRLKAIRDAKRQAARVEYASEPVVRKAMSDVGRGDVDSYDRRYEDSLSSRRAGRDAWREPEKRIPPPRVGLPTNPRRR